MYCYMEIRLNVIQSINIVVSCPMSDILPVSEILFSLNSRQLQLNISSFKSLDKSQQ